MDLHEPDWAFDNSCKNISNAYRKYDEKLRQELFEKDVEKFKLLQEIARSCKLYLWWNSEEMKDRQSIKVNSLVTEYVLKYGTFKPEEYEEALESIKDE